MTKPTVGITMGDPAGIGPELCLNVVKNPEVMKVCKPVIYGDLHVLERIARHCKLTLPDPSNVVDCGVIKTDNIVPGRVQKECGAAAYQYILKAIDAAIEGHVSAVATAPINKEALHVAGIRYPGHTEIFADKTNTQDYCMMMASEEIKVALATIHTSYAAVPAQLSKERIFKVTRLTHTALAKFGVDNPLIGVCALNPHAGEHGLFGNEESDIIIPAIQLACKQGMNVQGPLCPDSAFLPDNRKSFDAYIVMYHDQGLIPFKMLAFDIGVNLTLGLPVIRTSVDHGTAFDIAWQGRANATSMVQSILWAARLS